MGADVLVTGRRAELDSCLLIMDYDVSLLIEKYKCEPGFKKQ